jgi:cell filamentation protein, protein adenylyltransferase
MFDPTFQITPQITRHLMAIEASRQAVIELPIDVEMLRSLRETAKLLTTHYSTQIEGNRLTQAQVAEVVAGTRFPGRSRDESEVRHYYSALELVEELARATGPILEVDLGRVHGMAFRGQPTPTPYRDGQNLVRDGISGGIVYMPPQATDVPGLMAEFVEWINASMAAELLPIPLIAALVHYQFVTVHPYYDGNGRTARLLTTLILHRGGYGLKGIYSLEEYYARDLEGYYNALAVGSSHNYYEGRREADVSDFIEYFCRGMAEAFAAVQSQAGRVAARATLDKSRILRQLGPRERQVLILFRSQGTATTAELAEHLGLSPRTVSALCRKWVSSGFLDFHDSSRKNRAYRLAPAFEETV